MGVALSYALWAVSNNFLLFVLARIIGGLSKGNVSLTTAIVTDVTTVERRSKGMVRKWNVLINTQHFHLQNCNRTYMYMCYTNRHMCVLQYK